MKENKGIWAWAQEKAEEVEYKPWTIDDFNSFIDLCNKQPVPERQFSVPVSGYMWGYMEAERKGDKVGMEKYREEIYISYIQGIRRTSQRTGLDFDIVFMLYNKYSHVGFNSDAWMLHSEYPNDYEDITINLESKDGKWFIVKSSCYGWSSEELYQKEVEDIFEELILKDIEL